MLQNDVALSVATSICEKLRKELRTRKVGRFEDRKTIVRDALRRVLVDVLTVNEAPDVLALAEEKKARGEPLVVIFVGIHGTGKTTSIAKMTRLFQKNNYSVVLACSDTYRAGSVEQLEGHARKIGVRVIKHKYGGDAAAVAFDAIEHARARNINVVLIDTAGRMETNRGLMESMAKIARVSSPDLVIFVGDALAGNDAVSQASEFNRYVPISGTILTKMDADARGGAAISIAFVTQKPILFLGSGQGYDDLVPFDPQKLVNKILS